MILACENCRRRKVRCSGSSPCTSCQRHMQECHFEYSRKRRGPRPKRRPPPSDVSTISEPAVPGPAVAVLSPKSVSAASTASAPTPPAAPMAAPTAEPMSAPVSAPTLALLSAEAMSSDSGRDIHAQDAIVERSILPDTNLSRMRLWKARLVQLQSSKAGHRGLGDYLLSADLMLHLIVVFHATVNGQQSPILSPAVFFADLEADTAPLYLCHAMCLAALRFTRHKLVHGTDSGREEALAQALESSVRQSLTLSSEEAGLRGLHGTLRQAWTLAILAVHAVQHGNGLKAWQDTHAGLHMVSILKHAPDSEGADTLQTSILLLQSHLGTSAALLALGHGAQLSSTILLLRHLSMGERPRLLIRLASLLLQCSGLGEGDHTRLGSAPWAEDSPYTSLKREVDRLYVMHMGDLTFEDDVLAALEQTEIGAGEYVLRLSMLYATRILLDRPFLPMGTTGSNGASVGDGSRRILHFPGAPTAFARERSAACIKSARSLTAMCRCILDRGFFFLPPFLGYALFLSGFVFLNNLHVEENTDRLEECIDDLKTIFTVLGVMRTFYHPAHLWVDTLFHVHTLDRVKEPPPAVFSGARRLFDGFFQRFPGVKEPPYCTLSARQAFYATAPPPGDSGWTAQLARAKDALDSGKSTLRLLPAEKKAVDRNSLDEYRKAIGEALGDMGDGGDGEEMQEEDDDDAQQQEVRDDASPTHINEDQRPTSSQVARAGSPHVPQSETQHQRPPGGRRGIDKSMLDVLDMDSTGQLPLDMFLTSSAHLFGPVDLLMLPDLDLPDEMMSFPNLDE